MSLVDNSELKAGHAPANKVGGRRVVNRKDRNNSDSIEHTNSESSDEVGVREIIDCDLPAKMEKSYPTIAVKKSHEKPIPTHQVQSLGTTRATVGRVVQPRKQTH